MDQFILIFIILLSGSFTALISKVISSLSIDKLSLKLGNKENKIEKISELKDFFDDYQTQFLAPEILIYTVAAILTGINILETFSEYSDYWQYIIYSIVIFTFTVFFFRAVFSALGRRYSLQIAENFYALLLFYTYISKPFVLFIGFIENKLGGDKSDDAVWEELDQVVETAMEEGSMDQDEYRIFKNLIHFSDVSASDVMTPRTVMFSCEADLTIDEVINLPELKMYSRIPIWEGESLDDGVVGYILTKDILLAALQGKNKTYLREYAREVTYIPENAPLDTVLDTLLQKRQHIILVVDEYGGIEGILAMEDVLETILGVEIVDEADKVIDLRALAVQRRDNRIATMMNHFSNE